MKIALRDIVGKGIILNILLCYQIGQISDCSQAGQGQERYQISKRGLMPGSLRRVQHQLRSWVGLGGSWPDRTLRAVPAVVLRPGS